MVCIGQRWLGRKCYAHICCMRVVYNRLPAWPAPTVTPCDFVLLFFFRSTLIQNWSSRSWRCPSAASTVRRDAAGLARWSSCRWEASISSLTFPQSFLLSLLPFQTLCLVDSDTCYPPSLPSPCVVFWQRSGWMPNMRVYVWESYDTLLLWRCVSLRATSPPAPSMWYPAPIAALSSWRAVICPTTCSTTAPNARSSASSVAASSRVKPTR